jgi:hypothetical protein
MSKKNNKNLQRVQEMLDGNYKNKVQSGYVPKKIDRKVGEIWKDSDGIEWEQKNGYRMKLTKTANVGIFEAHCSDCKSGILKPWDKDTHKADGRCYHCQLNYELDLKYDKPIRWFAYRRLKELQNMESIEKDMVQWIDEMNKNRNMNIFDKSIVNALSNSNIEESIRVNKNALN